MCDHSLIHGDLSDSRIYSIRHHKIISRDLTAWIEGRKVKLKLEVHNRSMKIHGGVHVSRSHHK
jgi:hypothetical protein